MTWSKLKPIDPNDKRLRCEATVTRDHCDRFCGRLAKLYRTSHHGNDLGEIQVCGKHARLWSARGLDLVIVDRRKKRNAEKQP